MKSEAKRGKGRPPKEGPMMSKYPKVMIYMEPGLRAQLRAASAILNVPAWKLVSEAVEQRLKQLPKADREALEALAARFAVREKEQDRLSA